MKIKLLICFLIITYYSNSQNNIDTIIFSHESGVYSDSIFLSLSNLSSDKIYYSDNGDFPNKEYKEPIFLNKSTSIRVKNYKTIKGYSKNYIFPGRKINLPIVCLTVKPSDLYDSTRGIYVKGYNASPIPPYKGANFHKNWERVSYIEFIDTNNTIGFNQKVGIKIFGQFSSMLPQKSFSIFARKKYGKGKIKYPIFPDLPFKKYKSFILRNSGSDNCNSHFRDVMMTSLVKNFNIETQAYRSCVVYINGKYWGIYHLREKINEHYLKQHFKVDKDSVAILKHRGDVQHYGRINYKNVLKFIKKTDFKNDSNILLLSKLIDIDNYLDYNISQVYFSNIDAGGNIRYWRERNKNGKWRWILFDTDFGFGLRKGNGVDENTLKRFTEYSSEAWPFPSWSTLIIRKLLENDSIKELYIQKFTKHLNTTFKPENVKQHINDLVNTLKLEMPYHLKKWRHKPSKWNSKVNYILDFAERRPNYLFQFISDKFNLDTTINISFNYNKEQGIVFFDSYKIDSGYSGKYYKSKEYLLKVKPKFGFEFLSWESDNKDTLHSFTSLNDTTITALFRKKNKSKYSGKIIFNEIGCNDSLASSYIELYNNSDSAINISNWILRNGNNWTTIKDKTILESKSYYSLIKDSIIEKTESNNSQYNLFNIYKNNTIELFSNKEEMVDSLFVDERLLKTDNSIELINTIIENKWVSSNKSSINKINNKHLESNRNNKIILVSFFSLISLLIFTALYFRNKSKK